MIGYTQSESNNLSSGNIDEFIENVFKEDEAGRMFKIFDEMAEMYRFNLKILKIFKKILFSVESKFNENIRLVAF